MNPQSAIIPDHCKAAVFIEADIRVGQLETVKAACRQSIALTEHLQQRFEGCALGATIGFGDGAWKAFGHHKEGGELKPFRALGGGLAPATQHDLLIHVQALQFDAAFALAQEMLALFGESVTVVTEEHGYRLYQERGLDGFVDGTENPQDEKVAQTALIPAGRPDAGGSYVLLQKYLHDLKKWDAQGVAKQEACIGRTKDGDEELDKSARLPDSHLGRVDLKENGAGLKIVRRSLPFGKISGEHGLMFLAYCHTLYNIEAQLLSMFGGRDGQTDLVLKHLATAVSGAYYYAPPLERLGRL
ncbi:Dyp-type peroxidase [Neisseria sp. ZJ106]|uniref:Dyp-type peroxidase n=1 Tax=Neisseria lisongii TaxID=2912188 RepID=A0ABY7RM00_9NEIS|nr:Dyp-type peroxidase [Neisseria lisongii]MCF7522174.1 Dyp-type peroxidase [Neisseria lisongii]WCL72258.1 Dyp-type peroxidase [Neisseria lisongii]